MSLVLPAIKRVADDHADVAGSTWLAMEIRGVNTSEEAPLVTSPEVGSGLDKFGTLRAIEDTEALTIAAVKRGVRSSNALRKHVLVESISHIEKAIPRENEFVEDVRTQMRAGTLVASEWSDRLLRVNAYNHERERVLELVRTEAYDYVSYVIRELNAELQGSLLVGPEYRLVLSNMSALDTELGDDLRAALDKLSSSNPADWNASALLCRNVVLKLGRNLWRMPDEKYYCGVLGTELDLKGERELNKLTAYVDRFFCATGDETLRPEVEALLALAKDVYGRGSAGKQQVRKHAAQQLVVDTFDLVARLHSLTELQPAVG